MSKLIATSTRSVERGGKPIPQNALMYGGAALAKEVVLKVTDSDIGTI